jgi:hypothetical protein
MATSATNSATPSPSPRAQLPAPPPTPKRLRDEVKAGQHLYEMNYHVVKSVERDAAGVLQSVLVSNLKGKESIIPAELLDELKSTSHYASEQLVTPTTLSAMPETFKEEPFGVTFNKKVEPNDVADALASRLEEAGESQAKRRKVMRELMKGERRVMNAKLRLDMYGKPIMPRGRFSVLDLDVAHKGSDPGIRLIDSRTITELVFAGVRYYSNEHKDE